MEWCRKKAKGKARRRQRAADIWSTGSKRELESRSSNIGIITVGCRGQGSKYTLYRLYTRTRKRNFIISGSCSFIFYIIVIIIKDVNKIVIPDKLIRAVPISGPIGGNPIKMGAPIATGTEIIL